MATCPVGVPPFWIQMPLRECLQMTIDRQRPGSLISLGDSSNLVYRLPLGLWHIELPLCSPQVTEARDHDWQANSEWYRPRGFGGFIGPGYRGNQPVRRQEFFLRTLHTSGHRIEQPFVLKCAPRLSFWHAWPCRTTKNFQRLQCPDMPLHIWRNLLPSVQGWQRISSLSPQRLKDLLLEYRRVLHCSRDSVNNDAGSSSIEAQYRFEDQMTGPLQDTALTQARTTPGYRMDNLFLMRSGGADVTVPSIWPQICTMNCAPAQRSRVTNVIALGAFKFPLANASVVTTGVALSI
eukprot:1144391-Amphidinium_carterae.1